MYAQLAKGSKTIFGEANIGYSNTALTQYFNNSFYNTNIGISPGYGSFLSDWVYLSAQVIVNSNTVASSVSFDKFTKKSFGGQLGLRFYAFNTPEFNLFAELSANILTTSSTYDASTDIFTPSISVGSNFLLNSTNALDFKLSYSRISDLKSNSYNGYRAGLFSLNVGLTNFISKEIEDGMEDLTKGGRNTINGTFSYGLVSYYGLTNSYLIFNPDYGHFIFNNFMVGAKMNLGWEESRNARISIQPYVRYYVPISSKFFVYPNASLNYTNNDKFSQYYVSSYQTNYSLGMGVSYFLKRNIAIEADVFKYEFNTNSKVFFAGLNIGLKYFIRM
jgi:hypothetical protein